MNIKHLANKAIVFLNPEKATYWHTITRNILTSKPKKLGRYYLNFESKFYYPEKIDEEGIPLYKLTDSPYFHHPIVICQYALGIFEHLYQSNFKDEKLKSDFMKQINWLDHNFIDIGFGKGWNVGYDIPEYGLYQPWYLGLAQGEAASILTRAYLITNETKYLKLAEEAIRPFEKLVSDGGLLNYFNTFPVYEEYPSAKKTVGASERIFDILQEEGEFDLQKSPEATVKLNGNIQLNNIKFSYPTRKDITVLNDISITINRGDKIALAGYSGSGKSTIAQLIMQMYTPDSGSIYFDDKPGNTFEKRQLRYNMAVVPQEVLLFGGTIKENIAYGKPNATDDEIIEAAKKANAWQFIAQFPEQLHTVVGERGVKLSGGQRQRIAIARAILKDPAILILDEATSSLDSESEKLVQDALEILMENRTTIIIAHRLSTIRNVDTIFVLNNGKIVETGNFEALSKIENGVFNNLLKLQFNES